MLNAIRRGIDQIYIDGLLLFQRYAAAAEQYARILLRHPEDEKARFALASLQIKAGHLNAAREHYQILATGPSTSQRMRADVFFNLGYLADTAQDFSEAENFFKQALLLDPNLDRAWYGLGLIYVRQQRLEEAAQALQHCTELQPMSPYAWYQLAMVHQQSGKASAAEKILKHLKTFEPKFARQLERDLQIQH